MFTPAQIKKHVDANEKLRLQTHYNFISSLLERDPLTSRYKMNKYRKMLALHLIDIIKTNLLTNKEKFELLECNYIIAIEKQSGGYYSLYDNLSSYRHFQSRDTTLTGILQSAKTFLEQCLEKEFKIFFY